MDPARQEGNAKPFARALRELLATRRSDTRRSDGQRVRAVDLATALGVDQSLVAHWLRGTRVPSLRANYLASIAAFLHLEPEEREQLEAAYNQDVLSRAERQADGRAVAERGSSTNPLPGVAAVPSRSTSLPASAYTSVQKLTRLPIKGEFASVAVELPEDLRSAVFPTAPYVIRGVEAGTRMVIQMVAKAGQRAPLEGQAIYITYFGAESMLPTAEVKESWWYRAALRGALQRGWDVYHLIRLNDDLSRSIDIVEAMQWYLGTGGTAGGGTYKPYYFTDNPHQTLPVPYGPVIVPGIGALLGLATTQADHLDAGLFLPDDHNGDHAEGTTGRAHVKLLLDHVRQFLETRGLLSPLLIAYPNDDPSRTGSEAFDDAISRAEQRPGGRMLVKGGLSHITRPASYYAAGSNWLEGRTPEEQARSVGNYRLRQAGFRQHVLWYPYRDLITKSGIRTLIEQGKYARDDQDLKVMKRRADVKEVWDHLTNVIDMLRSHSNYEIALLDEDEEPGMIESFWEAIGDHTVLLESWRPTDSGTEEEEVDVEITEPSIVRAFQAYGQLLWNKVRPANRHKPTVIAWFEARVRELEDQYPDLAQHKKMRAEQRAELRV